MSDFITPPADLGRFVCINCGGTLRGVRCKLVCVSGCGYFESCSDLEPAPPFVLIEKSDR